MLELEMRLELIQWNFTRKDFLKISILISNSYQDLMMILDNLTFSSNNKLVHLRMMKTRNQLRQHSICQRRSKISCFQQTTTETSKRLRLMLGANILGSAVVEEAW
jgi:hypothetical protein